MTRIIIRMVELLEQQNEATVEWRCGGNIEWKSRDEGENDDVDDR